MINRVLGPDSGITHDVFKEQSQAEEPVEEEEGSAAAPVKSTDILDTFKGLVYEKEVVRQPRMHYQKVPRLGCYMAVPLVYNSCLSDAALETLVQETITYNTACEEQVREREAYEAEV